MGDHSTMNLGSRVRRWLNWRTAIAAAFALGGERAYRRWRSEMLENTPRGVSNSLGMTMKESMRAARPSASRPSRIRVPADEWALGQRERLVAEPGEGGPGSPAPQGDAGP